MPRPKEPQGSPDDTALSRSRRAGSISSLTPAKTVVDGFVAVCIALGFWLQPGVREYGAIAGDDLRPCVIGNLFAPTERCYLKRYRGHQQPAHHPSRRQPNSMDYSSGERRRADGLGPLCPASLYLAIHTSGRGRLMVFDDIGNATTSALQATKGQFIPPLAGWEPSRTAAPTCAKPLLHSRTFSIGAAS